MCTSLHVYCCGTTSIKTNQNQTKIRYLSSDIDQGMEIFLFYIMHWSIPVVQIPLGISQLFAYTLVESLKQPCRFGLSGMWQRFERLGGQFTFQLSLCQKCTVFQTALWKLISAWTWLPLPVFSLHEITLQTKHHWWLHVTPAYCKHDGPLLGVFLPKGS